MPNMLSVMLLASLLASASAGSKSELEQLYKAKAPKCTFFVKASGGSDSATGKTRKKAFASIGCAVDSECNKKLNGGDTICLLAGTHELSDTAYVKGSRMQEKTLTIMALGEDNSAILDGMAQASIFNALQTSVLFKGITFSNGKGSSGGAVYGERELEFENCHFIDNEASVHGGAVMGGRFMRFDKCEFIGNRARFAGAVRVNDIGSAKFNDCLFLGNSAEGRGGAVITQIEKPDSQSVVLTNCQFCFNESPISPNIYNFRTKTHECKKCRFNSKQCCTGHGRVVAIEDATSYTVPEGETRTRVCQCDDGWKGERCDTAVESVSRTDL